ncbi:MAG: preprotein translocase subunit SecG [Bacteroidales bacterium]|nr:preprotein translocase subunit SecG [Bacteroidales bacterium]
MYTVITWLIVVVCIFLVITVLVQNAKGGGLAQNFAGQQQLMGVRKTTHFLESATWTLGATIMVLSFVSVAFLPTSGVQAGSSEVDQVMQNVQTQQAAPSFGTPISMPDSAAQAE